MRRVEREPGALDVISIRDPGNDAFDHVGELCRNILVLRFHDVMEPTMDEKAICPKENQIREAIDWCQGRQSVLIHCRAGVSRSAALAVVIGCVNGLEPSAAFSDILNPLLHFPNPMIIDIGSDILGLDLRSERLKFEQKVATVFDPDIHA
jgi:predicted protein tyrosine phosphatase